MVVGGRSGLHNEGLTPVLLDPVHHRPDQDGAEVRRVVPLPHVALDRDGVPRLEASVQIGLVEELLGLRGEARGEAGVPVVHEIDFASHDTNLSELSESLEEVVYNNRDWPNWRPLCDDHVPLAGLFLDGPREGLDIAQSCIDSVQFT